MPKQMTVEVTARCHGVVFSAEVPVLADSAGDAVIAGLSAGSLQAAMQLGRCAPAKARPTFGDDVDDEPS